MNNIAIKILILWLVISLAVVGILFFSSTIMRPPVPTKYVNKHMQSVEDSILTISISKTLEENINCYDCLIDKIEIYDKENILSKAKILTLKEQLFNRYIPIFQDQCTSKFKGSTWYDKDLNLMKYQISEFYEISKSSNYIRNFLIPYNEYFGKILSYIDNYHKAKKLANSTTFYSTDDARKKIGEAEDFLNLYPLYNCTELVELLKHLKTKIGTSHYQQIEQIITKQLSNYNRMSLDEYETLESDINNRILEYDNNSYIYGSNAPRVDDLVSLAKSYIYAANRYYNGSIDINTECLVNTNNEWHKMAETPVRNYDCYTSNNSYYINSPTMSFTITGCDKFSFYIRSNGTKYIDYVIVGFPNERPSISRNFANNKGLSSTTNTLAGYKKVTFVNLSKEKKYTIWIQYCKLSKEMSNGYVLIPKAYTY